LKRFLNGNLVQIIKGPRRAGKSSLLKLIYKELKNEFDPLSFLFINLEDVSLAQENNNPELLERIFRIYRERVFPSGKAFVFIDEVQRIYGWERWVETYRESESVKFFITGSSSKLSSVELGSLLTGRHIDITLYPFSFRDYLFSKDIKFDNFHLDMNKDLIKNNFLHFLKIGGFPEVLLNYDIYDGYYVLESYFNDIIYRDIVERWGIRDSRLMKRIALFALKNNGNLISYRQIQRLIENISGKISPNTVSEYISHLLEAYMIFEVYLYSNSLKKSNYAKKKVYSVDTGLRNAVVKSLTEDYARNAENVVFIEILRRNYNVSFWNNDKGEVDFVCSNRDKNLLINVTATNLENVKLKDREIIGLCDFPGDNFKRILLTKDIEDVITYDKKKINLIPIWKWLLKK